MIRESIRELLILKGGKVRVDAGYIVKVMEKGTETQLPTISSLDIPISPYLRREARKSGRT